MKKALIVSCCACVALLFCARASANVAFGITEDTGALGDPSLFYTTLNDLGATENRIAISWDPANPTAIPAQPALDVWVPEASSHAVSPESMCCTPHPPVGWRRPRIRPPFSGMASRGYRTGRRS